MTKDEIKKILLDAVGNPGVGPVKESAEVQAAALAEALSPKKAEKKENRVLDIDETR